MREYEKRSGKTPKPLINVPELSPNNYLYYIAYIDLAKKKITYESINAYAELAKLDKTELLVKVTALEELHNGNNSS